MKKIASQIWVFLGIAIILVGCLKEKEYSNTPKIKFKRLQFVDVDNAADSLKLTFDFEDGDGDIGLTDLDVWGEYIPFFLVVYYDSTREREDGKVGEYVGVTLSDTLVKPPFYLANEVGVLPEVFSETDNRPTFNCNDYYFEDALEDTFFVVRNEYYSNMHLKFFKKRNGVYNETSIAQEFNIDDCNAVVEVLRIPIFDPERLGKPTVGNITYSYLSNGIKPFLAQDTFKLQFFIYDRALNQSNIVDTPDFLLSDIIRD